jgi:lysozyme
MKTRRPPRRSRKSAPKTSARTSALRTFVRAVRFGAVTALALGVASCAIAPSSSRYPAKSDVKPHAGVATAHRLPIHGVDISKWQGKVDWAALRQAGTQFAFIKATEGGDHVDSRFLENWWAARNAGVPRGAYHFVYWCRPAHEQAAWFKKNVPQDPDALPPVLDVEWNGESVNCPRKVPRQQALAMIDHMLREMEAHTGKRPIIYTDITFHQEILEGEFNDYPYWIRSTAAEPHHRYNNRRWTFWQFTTTGRVPGVSGDIDRNAFYGTENQWRMFVQSKCDPRDHQRLRPAGVCRDVDTAVQTASVEE